MIMALPNTNIQSFSLEKVLLMRTPIPFMSRTKPEFEAKASVNILILKKNKLISTNQNNFINT
jgi:hypothetical protein